MIERRMINSPCRINGLVIKNRIIMEPMGNGIAEPNGDVSPEDIAFYEARAKGGVGLIMSEATSVDSKTGRGNPNNMCVDQDHCIPGLKRLADRIHKYDSAFFVELYHPGRQGSWELNGGQPVYAPSEIECGLVHSPVKAMSADEIDQMTEQFIRGAVRCQKAGVDGVLLHGAHGYLINEFLSPYTNKRTDEYGGSTENRARFAVRIIRGIRQACGEDFPIGIRLSACEYLDYIGKKREEGITLELTKEYVKIFESSGIDLIDVSAGIYETMNTAWEPVGFDQGWKADNAREIKKITNLPVVCTAVIRDPSYAEQLLEEGACDFIGSARAHLADPEWAEKAITGRDNDIRKCISCLNCMKTLMSGPVHCAVNAQACHELERSDLKYNGDGRRVVVLGGGPAGMEAARVLALRGFKPVIFEKESTLGGTFLLASLPPHKEKLKFFIDYLQLQLEKLGVEIRLESVPTREEVAALDPYAVFIACGADPVIPNSIPGLHGEHVCTIFDVLRGKTDVSGNRVTLIGGGMAGLETAEYLLKKGCSVSVYEMADQVASGEHFQNVIDIETRLRDVPQHTGYRLLRIEDDVCVFESAADHEVHKVPYELAVLSMGQRPAADPVEEYSGFDNLHVIGANKKFGPVAIAVEDAYLAAYSLQ